MPMKRVLLVIAAAVAAPCGVTAATSSAQPSAAPPTTEAPPPNPDRDGLIDADATTGSEPEPLPVPDCWWESKPSTNADRAREQGFWEQIDGGDHAEDVLVFLEDGVLHRTFASSQNTYRLRIQVCTDPTDTRHGQEQWDLVGPPNPTVYWDQLTERVTRRVPLPNPDLGFEPGPDGAIDIVVQLGLWIAVTNPDDVVARAEPAPGVWAETRASLVRIEFDSGTGTTVTDGCEGAGTPLDPADADTTIEQGPCGYTYTTVDELGDHTAVVRAIWSVVNTTSAGDVERRADLILETDIPISIYEIQTVGVGN